MTAACAVLAVLLAVRSGGFLHYLFIGPGALDGTSLRLILSDGVWPLLLAGALWGIAWGLGRRALRALDAPPADPVAEIAGAALGLGLLGEAVFALGWAGGLSPVFLLALVLAAAVLAAGALPRTLPRAPRPERAAGLAAGLLSFAAAQAVLRACAPPSDWDVRSYHLALPELYLRAGRALPVPWMIHSHWPHLMEVLYALPLAAGRDGAAALTHFGAAVLLIAAVSLAARRAAGPAAGWTAALLLAGQPVLLSEAGTARADAACALFAFAAAWTVARWAERPRDGALIAAGLLAGLSAATKMTGLALVAGGTVFLVLRSRRARPAAVFAAAAAAAAGPWLLKTWLSAGSPFWPFASRSPDAAALAARYLASNRWSFPPPAAALLHDGPLFLLLPVAGLALLVRRPRRGPGDAERVLLASLPFFLLLTWLHHEAWRFLLPVWPLAALAGGRRAADAFAAGGRRRAAAVLLVGAAAAPIVAASPNNALFAVLAPRSAAAPAADRRALWADRRLDGLPGFYRDARAVLPPGAKVLLWREIRGYGAGFDYLWGDPMNQALIDYRALPGPDALYARLKSLGVTHVLAHPSSRLYREDPGYYDRRTLALMDACLRAHARPVLSRGGFELYRLL
jgi:hypothetical protein